MCSFLVRARFGAFEPAADVRGAQVKQLRYLHRSMLYPRGLALDLPFSRLVGVVIPPSTSNVSCFI